MNMQLSIRLGVMLVVLAGGCERKHLPAGPSGPPVIPVARPVVREVEDFEDFTGRTDAVNYVDVRARVTGYIVKVTFKDGDFVKRGDLLYQIDPRPYQATLDRNKGDVVRLEGQKQLIDIQVDRYTKLVAKGAASQQDLDMYLGQRAENAGALAAARAAVEYADLNLKFCTIASPIAGKLSRTLFTEGNLINQDNTLLTTIASLEPMYAYFDVDERTMLKILRRLNDGRIKPSSAGEFPVRMGLADESGYPHLGRVNYVNNKVDPLTGTITVRGVFDNPQLAGGKRLLVPGMFVRIRLPLGQPHQALLVAERCLVTDQGLKNVFVVDAQNKVQYRRVTVGPTQSDGLKVILDGLKPDDWVVVSGQQMVRPNLEVEPEKMDMPVAAADSPDNSRPHPPADKPSTSPTR